jgi:hypothetical protein
MTKRLLQLAGIVLAVSIAALAPSKAAQACDHECTILCSPPTHCCIVGGCAGCYAACPPA